MQAEYLPAKRVYLNRVGRVQCVCGAAVPLGKREGAKAGCPHCGNRFVVLREKGRLVSKYQVRH